MDTWKNEEYCVRFYLSCSDNAKYSIDAFGAYFSINPVFYTDPNYNVLPLQPQVENPTGNFITDTANWVLISGSFIASGGEKYITIGNF